MTTHNILKTAACESISGRSTLTYQIGIEIESKAFQIRLSDNSGNGYFSDDWISLDKLSEIAIQDNFINAFTINQLFNGKSVNTGGFLIAALKQEGFIKASTNSKRSFVLNEESSLIDELTKLANKPKRKGATK